MEVYTKQNVPRMMLVPIPRSLDEGCKKCFDIFWTHDANTNLQWKWMQIWEEMMIAKAMSYSKRSMECVLERIQLTDWILFWLIFAYFYMQTKAKRIFEHCEPNIFYTQDYIS
ncbi:unnamed protein product [Allacma fusca]|uniref:Uncharacterized protein n=1 Tax=Allacma fusca TaxID=39272 RepID=A0A8J2LLE5_9HEXA|nr:unnamed protein product [Allacma fusca]